MTLEQLYAKSQLELESTREVLQAEQVEHAKTLALLVRLVKGDVLPAQVQTTDVGGLIKWSFNTEKKDA